MTYQMLCLRLVQFKTLFLLVVTLLLGVSGCSDQAPPEVSANADGPAASAATGPPVGHDVWLLDLVEEGGALRAVSPRNLTDRPGYDNQPFFSPTGDLLYVQMDNERTDLWRWSRETGSSTRLTLTPTEGEYSPTPIPDSDGGISYIRSKDDVSGRLWRMPREGADPEVIFPDIGPVGYHAWFDADHVALWRLQEPSLLRLVELDTQAQRTLATGVGLSPQSVPGRRAVSFTRETDEGTIVEVYDLDEDRTVAVALLPDGGSFHTWTPGGVLLSSTGSEVIAWRNGDWQQVADLKKLGLKISRLAVSPDGAALALVAEPDGGK